MFRYYLRLGLRSLGSTPALTGLMVATVGLGIGVFISPNSSALMGAAPRKRQGTAGSILAESRVLGMLIGVALATAVFQAAGGKTGSACRYGCGPARRQETISGSTPR